MNSLSSAQLVTKSPALKNKIKEQNTDNSDICSKLSLTEP